MFRKKLFIKIIIAFLLIALGLGMIFIGEKQYVKGADFDILSIIAVICSLVILILFIVNLIIISIFKKKRVDSDAMEDKILQKKKYAEENYFEYYNKVKKHIFFADLYFAVIILLLLSIYLILSFVLLSFELNFYFLIIVGLTLYVAIIYFIGNDLPKDRNRNEIKEKDYPKLWEMIKRIANDFNVKKNIKCFVTYDNNAGVIELDRYIEIFLGVQLVYLMNEEELENIFIHEFAHIHLNHTSRSILINKRMEQWKILSQETPRVFQKFARVLYYPVSTFLNFDYELFQLVSSRLKEDEADKYIIEKGNKQAHINALAKMSIYNFFLYDEAFTINEVYESEVITDKYFSIIYEIFIEYYEINKDFWCELILKRIPARIESHYPFKYRMDLLDVKEFQIDFYNKIPEIDSLINLASKLIRDEYKLDYENQRKQNYLIHLNLINEYEKGEVEFNQLKLFDLAFSYRVFGRIEDAINIYNILIEKTGERPKLIMAKGTALLSLYDNSGIELIYKAMKLNNNFLKPGIEIISEYCLKMGLEEERLLIRTFLKEHRDFVINVQSNIGVNIKDKFLQTTLEESEIEKIVQEIIKDERIDKIYMVDKFVQKTYRLTIVGVLVKPDYIEQLEEILNNVYDYLDNDRSEEFFLLSLNYYSLFINKIKRTPFALKYQSK